MSEWQSIEQRLTRGLVPLNLSIPVQPLLDYLQLLIKWNHAYNLTAIREPEIMVGRHVLDSLAVMPWLQGTHVLDVGSGAGLPGIPIAIARPDLHIVLLDSNGKKTRFLEEVKRTLKLQHVDIVQSRVENYQPNVSFDTVVSRAFSELKQMTQWTTHLLGDHGIWLAMKGRPTQSELAALNYPWRVESYTLAEVEGERCCVIIEKSF